jgi:hypothetical protein
MFTAFRRFREKGMTTLTKQRRGSLNNTINREIKLRERKEFERLVAETGKKSHFMTINPVYSEWTEDKERGQWCPQNFDRNVGNVGFDDNAFATQFIDAMDNLHSKMHTLTRITESEYEETYKRMFAASYNIGRLYMEWEETFFGLTRRVEKWKNS